MPRVFRQTWQSLPRESFSQYWPRALNPHAYLVGPAEPLVPLTGGNVALRRSRKRGGQSGCIGYMARYAKIRLAANLMVAKYGRAAAIIARRRAGQSARRQDDAAVAAWTAIAKAALSVPPGSKEKSEATLADVLGGQVTRRVMEADQVEREDVERLMQETKRHRKDADPSE